MALSFPYACKSWLLIWSRLSNTAVKTNYHVWADPAFFNMNDAMHFDMKEVMECYEAISNENCECFVPMYAYEFFEKQGLLEFLPDVYYNISYFPKFS